jgi:hypothetical protein
MNTEYFVETPVIIRKTLIYFTATLQQQEQLHRNHCTGKVGRCALERNLFNSGSR